ncbi:hypothetical protein BJV78DRAFT_1164124 [Lactifluus subvellereus]|nr:hypothetical protein BJV78DRAFT_1164124 [Lactifluus subvellereus]
MPGRPHVASGRPLWDLNSLACLTNPSFLSWGIEETKFTPFRLRCQSYRLNIILLNSGQPRSRSQQFQSSGRGGAGNIRSSSASTGCANRSDRPTGPSKTRGRELRFPFTPGKVTSTGRGGAGNILSPSPIAVDLLSGDALSTSEAKQAEFEHWVIRINNAANKAKPVGLICTARPTQ